jgi:uncharacterized protein YycO
LEINVISINRSKKTAIIFVLIILTIFAGINVADIIADQNIRFIPDYEKIDIMPILKKAELTSHDYKTLLYQTGLGKPAIDELLSQENGINRILKFQENFFTVHDITCERPIFTNTEYVIDKEGNIINGFDLAPYKNGYVVITNTSHSFGWRHGHAAIITDEKNGEILEALTLGQYSTTQSINKLRKRPNFMMLKLKGVSQDTLDEIAAFAKQHLNNLPYSFTVGLFSAKNPDLKDLSSTHCSHLVWYPFMQFGYDVDSDGSWLVTPKDIANSDLFEIVQIYGLHPDNLWN